MVPTRFGDNSESDSGRGVAAQADGKIVVVGNAALGGPGTWLVARYLPNGSLDPSFGSGGTVRGTVVDGGQALPWAVAIQPDGKIVVGGRGRGRGDEHRVCLRALPAERQPRPVVRRRRRRRGRLVTPADDKQRAQALAIAPDGKVVASGETGDGAGVVRLTADGTPDPTFAGDGSLDLADGAQNDSDGVAVQADGSIVVAVNHGAGVGDGFRLVRLDNNGVPDPAFGTNGVATVPIGSGGRSTAVAIQPDGKIVAGGYAYLSPNPLDFAIARLNPSGTPDMSFSGDGQELTPISSTEDSQGNALVLQPNGRIVLAGTATVDSSGRTTLGFARYDTDGTLDSSFLGGGALFAPLPPGLNSADVADAALACDGGIATVGRGDSAPTAHSTFVTARILGDPTACPGSTRHRHPSSAPITPGLTRASTGCGASSSVQAQALSGTASDNVGLKKVEIALLRKVGKFRAARTKGSCLWLRNSRAGFKRAKPRHGRCAKRRWLRAHGTRAWVFKLRRRLPVGSYVLYARHGQERQRKHDLQRAPPQPRDIPRPQGLGRDALRRGAGVVVATVEPRTRARGGPRRARSARRAASTSAGPRGTPRTAACGARARRTRRRHAARPSRGAPARRPRSRAARRTAARTRPRARTRRRRGRSRPARRRR